MKAKRIFSLFALAVATISSCDKDPAVKGDGWGTLDPSGSSSSGSNYVYYKNTVKVMSFNVRYLNSSDGANIWSARSKGVYAMMKSEKPLVMGTQECKWQQRTDILSNCPEYAAIGVCRDDGKEESTSETMTIFYMKDSVTVEKWGTYWLSDSPDIPSKGWDGACYRCATWGVFKVNSTGKRFFYTNTHLDHKGETAKTEGAKLLVKKTAELNTENLPAILTADFNAKIDDALMQSIKENFKNAKTTSAQSDNNITYQAFGTSSGSIIDHIFYKGFITSRKYKCVNDSWEGVTYISDHYPIYAILEY